MLSFQADASRHRISIYCDAEGMATLLGALAKLVGERASLVHLRASGNGGHELSNGPNENGPYATEVIIDYAEGD